MKLGDKSGQFYLVSALIIIAMIIGFASITNYSRKQTPTQLEEVREELKIEAQRVLDYDTYNTQNKIGDFTQNYSSYIGKGVDVYYIVGEKGSIEMYKYDENKIKEDHSDKLTENDPIIEVNLEDNVYRFDLKPGKNFYFILSKNIGDEKYILTG